MTASLKQAFTSISTLAFWISIGLASTPSREQSFFPEDLPLEHAVALPSNVLNVLLRAKEVKEAFEDQTSPRDPHKLFRAANVQLSTPDTVAFVVIGSYPVSGADCSWFWIISCDHDTPKIVLWAQGNSIEVMRSKTNGYRNIRSNWSSASVSVTREYRYNRTKYVLWREISKGPGLK
jgi:hypothetical protein